MATTTKYLEYQIHLPVKSQVDALQVTYPAGIRVAPETAAVTYAAPVASLGVKFVSPGTWSHWFLSATSSVNYPRTLDTFSRKSGGWFGLSFLFGNTTNFVWVGKFVYTASGTPEIGGVPTEVVAIARRKFLVGFELPIDGETGVATDAKQVTRDASRHADGLGLSWREKGSQFTVATTIGGAAANFKTWERFYFRPRTMPSVTIRLWRAKLATGANRGCSIGLTPDGHLVVYNISDAGVETLQATSTDVFAVNTWYRLDLLLWAKNPGGTITIFIGRRSILAVTMPNGTGLGNNSTHDSSFLGDPNAAAAEPGEVDFDDWMGADWPTPDSGGRYTGLDWLNGSKLQRVDASAFNAGNAFTGDYRYLNQLSPGDADANAKVTSAVSGAALVVDTRDAQIDSVLGSLGAVSFLVCIFGRQLTAGDGTLGWRFGGLLDLATVTETTTATWTRRLYRPTGLTAPVDITPLELHHIKALNVNAADYWAFCAVVELIGTFGQEDVPQDETVQPDTFPARRGIHNAPYPQTPWARSRLAPISPVIIHSGTFVGTGTAIELLFRSPVNWVFIRRVAANFAGNFWWSSMLVGHVAGEQLTSPGMVSRAQIDPTFVPTGVLDDQEQRTVVTIVGDKTDVNTVGITYQYVAMMDPGARFHLNGLLHHDDSGPASFINPLTNPAFLPEYSFFHKELAGGTTTFTRYIKGPGHAADAGSILNAAEGTTIAAVAAGQITSLATIHGASVSSTPYSVWRKDDNSSDPNKRAVVQIFSYVGDGAASRSLTWAPPTGRRPLFVMVTPHNAASLWRDPAHTGTTSSTLSTGANNAATGITAGAIDGFSVGSVLNANAIIYEVFVLIGSATAGNNGFSIDGEFAVVEPDSPADGDFDDPDDSKDPEPTDPVDPDPDPGPDDEDDCLDPDSVCIAATTRVANVALTHIGVTKLLTNYCTQQSTEAQVVRALYEDSARKVLRDFPWPFATRYATLALAATQPTDQDWDFAYRQPIDCIFERRLVVDRGDGVDPKGPPFMLSADSAGGLILTNEAAAVLEYTCRPVCVAFAGDTLFRDALAWHLAGALAPPLTRMTDAAVMCFKKYDEALAKAHEVIKPGVPGLRDAVDGASPDAGTGCIAANILVGNTALLRIGCRTIANIATEQSREAESIQMLFESELRATLRDFPWKFAKRYAQTLTRVGGTSTVSVNPDWQYSYRLPTDYVAARRLVTLGTGRTFNASPQLWEVGSDATGGLLFTDELIPLLEYTARIACVVLRGDDLFKDALAWRLAAAVAPSLAQVDPDLPEQHGRGPEDPPQKDMRIRSKPNKAAMRLQVAQMAMRMYLRTLEIARIADANEAQREQPGEAPWIEGR